jgi:hypothetical protein
MSSEGPAGDEGGREDASASEATDGRSDSFIDTLRTDSVASFERSPRLLESQYEEERQNSEEYSRRFIYELIQNADDALRDTEDRGAVARFELTDDYLYVANTGRPITESDVDSLCTIGVSGKDVEEGTHATIGHKGRGFTSVLEITERPAIYSAGLSFRFDREASASALSTAIEKRDGLTPHTVPVLCLPFPVTEEPPIVDRLLSAPDREQDFQTIFALELRDGIRDRVERDLRDIDQEMLLFLRHLDELEIVIDGEEMSWVLDRTRQERSAVEINRIDITRSSGAANPKSEPEPQQVPDDSDAPRRDDEESGAGDAPPDTEQFLVFRCDEIPVPPETTNKPDEDITHTEVGLSLRYIQQEDGVHLRPFKRRPMVHVFLPTEQRTPIPMQVNGAFNTSMARREIRLNPDVETEYNAFMIQAALDLIEDGILPVARATATTAVDLLECFALEHPESPEGANAFEIEFTRRLRETVRSLDWIPAADEAPQLQEAETLYPPTSIVLPPGDGRHPELARDIAGLRGADPIPGDQEQKHVQDGAPAPVFPTPALLAPDCTTLLGRLGVKTVSELEIPALIEDAAADIQLRSYMDVEKRQLVDPVIDILRRVERQWVGDDDQAFKNACAEAKLFPIDAMGTDGPSGAEPAAVSTDAVDGERDERDDGADNPAITRVRRGDDRLFFPPEEGPTRIPIDGFQFLASAVYRPEGWETPRGRGRSSDGFQSVVERIWPVDEFRFDTFAQGVISPKLPRPGQTDPPAAFESLQNQAVLTLLKQLSAESVDPETPLAHQQRAKTNLFTLCRLPVPTRDGDWVPAHTAYFGTEWQPDLPDAGKIEHLLNGADVDVSFVATPAQIGLETDASGKEAAVTPEAPDSTELSDATESERADGVDSQIDDWRAFFTWLGVREHVHLSPLFAPDQRQQYAQVEDLTRPSKGSVLDALSDGTWDSYRQYLLKRVEEYPYDGFVSKSLYLVHDLAHREAFVATAAEDAAFAALFLRHLAYWWDQPPNGATELSTHTEAIVGLNRTQYHNVTSRSDGIPKKQERHRVGRNLWLWQLRQTPWIPTDTGTYPPTDVWQHSTATDRLAIQLGEDEQLDLLPVLELEAPLGTSGSGLLEALSIRQNLDTELEPSDAYTVVRNLELILTGIPDAERSGRIEAAQRAIKTVYRNLARRLPPAREGTDDEVWGETDATGTEMRVVAHTANGFELVPASSAFFVRSDVDRREARPFDVPTFILTERDAGRFGYRFGLRDFTDSLKREVRPGETTVATEELRQQLGRAAPHLLVRLAKDRPEQERSDLRNVERFIDRVTVVDELAVVRRLELADETKETDPESIRYTLDRTEGNRQPYLRAPGPGERSEQLSRDAAKLLCDYLEFANVEAVLLALQASQTQDGLDEYADYAELSQAEIDAKRDELDGEISYGLEGVPVDGEGRSRIEFSHSISDGSSSSAKQETDEASDDGTAASDRDRNRGTTDPDGSRGTDDSAPAPLHTIDSLSIGDTRLITLGNGAADDDREPGELIRNVQSTRLPTQNPGAQSGGTGTGSDSSGSTGAERTDEIEARGAEVVRAAERQRLHDTYGIEEPDVYIFDVSQTTQTRDPDSERLRDALQTLEDEAGISTRYPGFDLLIVHPGTGDPERLIELKAKSGSGSRASLTVNEWRTAGTQSLQDQYWLYIVGNLRVDAGEPYLHRIQNPAAKLYGQLEAEYRLASRISVDVADFDPETQIEETQFRVVDEDTAETE